MLTNSYKDLKNLIGCGNKKFNSKNHQLENFDDKLKGFSHFVKEVDLIKKFPLNWCKGYNIIVQ
jgi:hypothetical protein